VPEAGVAFAVAMLVGITLTLGAVAVVTAVARARVLAMAGPHVGLMRLSRGADALAGLLLVFFGLSRVL
jgi:nickel/cobalt transporter (NicO) family protein